MKLQHSRPKNKPLLTSYSNPLFSRLARARTHTRVLWQQPRASTYLHPNPLLFKFYFVSSIYSFPIFPCPCSLFSPNSSLSLLNTPFSKKSAQNQPAFPVVPATRRGELTGHVCVSKVTKSGHDKVFLDEWASLG